MNVSTMPRVTDQGRQGDIFLNRVAALPPDVIQINDNVLARGELTGHNHRIENAKVFRGSNDQLFILVEQEALLVHEEHGPILIAPGIYEVRRQREYDPSQASEFESEFAEPSRQVKD